MGGEPRLLILETSGRVGQVAVAAGPELFEVRRLEEARRQARDLTPAIADLLAVRGWKPRDVQAVLVSQGPGSYTGLRVGIMAAKTFAYATGAALLAVETFAAIARQAPAEVTRLDVLADAQQGRVYQQRFARSGPAGAWRAESPLGIEQLADWLARREPDVGVTGPGLHVYGASLPQGLPVISPEAWDPRAESLLQIGLARFRAGERDDVWAVEPLYLRPSAAEEQLARSAGNPKSQIPNPKQ